MFERISGFFSGAGNGKDLQNADAFLKVLDKKITALQKSGHAGADEHLKDLVKFRGDYSVSVDGYNAALKSGSGVDTAKNAFKAAHGEAKDAFNKAQSFTLKSTWMNRGQKFGSFMASRPGKILTAVVGVPTFVLGTLAATGMISSSRNKKAMESREDLMMRQMEAANSEVASLQRQTMAMQQPNTLMGFSPVHGEHAQRVVAGRNGGMGLDTSNPAVNMSYDAVPARG